MGGSAPNQEQDGVGTSSLNLETVGNKEDGSKMAAEMKRSLSVTDTSYQAWK